MPTKNSAVAEIKECSSSWAPQRAGGQPQRGSITRVCPLTLTGITEGAPLLALFEKWLPHSYASASEVIREGLRLLEEHEQLKQQRLSEVRRKIDRGIEQLDRGLRIPGPEARARLRQRKKRKVAFGASIRCIP